MRARVAATLVLSAIMLIGSGAAMAKLVSGALDDFDIRPSDPFMQQSYCGEDCRAWYQERGSDHRRNRYWRNYDGLRFWK